MFIKYRMEAPCLKCEGNNTIPVYQLLIQPGTNMTAFNENVCKVDDLVDPYCPGFVYATTGIATGKTKAGATKLLTKTFELVTNGYVEFDFTVNHLSAGEEFRYKLHDKDEVFTNIAASQAKKVRIDLAEGKYSLVFIFTNKGKEVADGNVVIKKIVIDGTVEGTISKCLVCPKGTSKEKHHHYKCVGCPFGYTFVDGKCVDPDTKTCPDFTTKQGDSCSLNEIIHNKEYGLRYNLMDLKENVASHCTYENELCDGKFFGPVKDNKSGNIFYISFASREGITLSDFSYTHDKDYINSGHIFMLRNGEKGNSTKLLQNIAKNIESVKLIPYIKDNPVYQKSGMLITYSESEPCDAHPGKRYRSYLFLYCSKSTHNDSPKLYKQDDCTFIFQWNTYQICPFCHKSAIKPIYVNNRLYPFSKHVRRT
jgi:hypothetical protein